MASLPDRDYEILRPNLRLVELARGDRLRQQDDLIPAVCFPLTGMISTIINLSDGRSVEAAMTGPEGIVDVAALGTSVSFGDHLVQGGGQAYTNGRRF